MKFSKDSPVSCFENEYLVCSLRILEMHFYIRLLLFLAFDIIEKLYFNRHINICHCFRAIKGKVIEENNDILIKTEVFDVTKNMLLMHLQLSRQSYLSFGLKTQTWIEFQIWMLKIIFFHYLKTIFPSCVFSYWQKSDLFFIGLDVWYTKSSNLISDVSHILHFK